MLLTPRGILVAVVVLLSAFHHAAAAVPLRPPVTDATGAPLALACWMNASQFDAARLSIQIAAHFRSLPQGGLPLGFNDVTAQVVGRASSLPSTPQAPWTWAPPLTPSPPTTAKSIAASATLKYAQVRWFVQGTLSQQAMPALVSSNSIAALEATTKCTHTSYAPRFSTDMASFQNVAAFNDGFYLLVGAVGALIGVSILAWLIRETRCCDCLRAHPAMAVVHAVANKTGLATLYNATEKRKKLDDDTLELTEFLDGHLTVPVLERSGSAPLPPLAFHEAAALEEEEEEEGGRAAADPSTSSSTSPSSLQYHPSPSLPPPSPMLTTGGAAHAHASGKGPRSRGGPRGEHLL